MCKNLQLKVTTISFFLFLFFRIPFAHAETMSNQNYVIKTQELETTSGNTTSEGNSPKSTAENLNSSVSEGVNFKIRRGFENLAPASPFSVSLSTDIIDFGALTPTNPIVRTLDLDINSGTIYGYSILVFENQSLTIIPPAELNPTATSKAIIPDTTCDNGQCSIENASEWSNALTYGFGYRCDNLIGADCDSSFIKNGYYKHFPNIASNDDPLSIMSGIGANGKKVRISYRVNIPGTQSQGIYSNIITYIAVPNF